MMTIKYVGKAEHFDHRLVTSVWFVKQTAYYTDVHDNHVYKTPIKQIDRIVED